MYFGRVADMAQDNMRQELFHFLERSIRERIAGEYRRDAPESQYAGEKRIYSK